MKGLKLDIQMFAASASIRNERVGNYNIESNNETQKITFTVTRTSGTTYWDIEKTLTFTLKYYNDDNSQTTLTQSIGFSFPSGSVGYSKSASVDFVVPHKTDGTQNITFEASIVTGTSAGTLNPTGTATLETIPRASSISVSDANIGATTNIVLNKASDSFTTTILYRAYGDSLWTTIVSKTSLQVYGWTVPTSFYNKIPNSKTIVCQFLAQTYNGDTLIGQKTTTATFTATGSPIINLVTAIDINSESTSLTGDNSKMIKYRSVVRVTVSAVTQNSAYWSSVTVNGTPVDNYGDVELRWVDTNIFNVVAIDSRGYQTTATYTMPMIDYIPLTLNTTLSRNQPTDGKVNMVFNGNYYDGSFSTTTNNSLTLQYRYIEKGGSWTNVSWVTISDTPTFSNNTYSLNYQISNIDYTKRYEFQVRAIDALQNPVEIIGINILKGTPVFWWDENGFYVLSDLVVNGSLTLNTPSSIINMIYPVGSIYMSVNSTSPATLFGGTWVQLEDRFLLGAGSTYSNGATGGEATHTLTVDEMPSHKHGYNGTANTPVARTSNNYVVEYSAGADHQGYINNTGGDQPHNNMPPYLVVYMWKRTA